MAVPSCSEGTRACGSWIMWLTKELYMGTCGVIILNLVCRLDIKVAAATSVTG